MLSFDFETVAVDFGRSGLDPGVWEVGLTGEVEYEVLGRVVGRDTETCFAAGIETEEETGIGHGSVWQPKDLVRGTGTC